MALRHTSGLCIHWKDDGRRCWLSSSAVEQNCREHKTMRELHKCFLLLTFLVISASACSTLPPPESSVLAWEDILRSQYDREQRVTIVIESGGRYSIDGHAVTLQQLSQMKGKMLLPREAKFMMAARRGATHGDVHALHLILQGQYLDLSFKEL